MTKTKNISKVFIVGMPISGKGTLRNLLDGHSQVINVPFQGLGAFIFTPAFEKFLGRIRHETEIKSMDNSFVRKISVEFESVTHLMTHGDLLDFCLKHENLRATNFDVMLAKKCRSGGVVSELCFDDFDFEFFDFHRTFLERVFAGNKIQMRVEEIFEIYMKTFLDLWKNKPQSDQPQHVVVNFSRRAEAITAFVRANPEIKFLYTMREPVGSIYANARHSQANIARQASLESLMFAPQYLQKYNAFYKVISECSEENNFLVIDFEKMVLEPKQTMQQVADFLQIDFEPILEIQTIAGKPLRSMAGKADAIEHDPYRDLDRVRLIALHYFTQERTTARVKKMQLGFFEKQLANLLVYKHSLKHALKSAFSR